MAKNQRFKKQYIIEVEGTTTNGSAEKFIDTALTAMITALDYQYKQVSVKVKEQE